MAEVGLAYALPCHRFHDAGRYMSRRVGRLNHLFTPMLAERGYARLAQLPSTAITLTDVETLREVLVGYAHAIEQACRIAAPDSITISM